MEYGSRYDDVSREVTETLADAAGEYLRLALKKLHETPVANVDPGARPQVLAGVLAIAIELLLKAVIAEQSVLALYKQVPPVVRLHATSADKKDRDAVRDEFVTAMQDGTQDTIEFPEAVECVFMLCPPAKEHLFAFLRWAPQVRNKCAHAVLPRSERHHVFRLAYAALRLVLILREHGRLKRLIYNVTEHDTHFLERFDVERAERVKKAIHDAREKVRTGKAEPASITIDSDDARVTTCPICGGDAVMEGATESGWEEGEKYRHFYADSFECDGCGLGLEDDEEIRLAGIPWVITND